MSVKSTKNGQNGANKPQQGMPAFVRCELSDADRKKVQSEMFAPGDLAQFIEHLVMHQIKVSFSYEVQNDAYGMYATGSSSAIEEYRGLCLTARGPSILGAATALSHKHFNLLAEDWRSASAWSKEEKWS